MKNTRAQRTDIRSALLPSNGRVQFEKKPLLGQDFFREMVFFFGRHCRNQPNHVIDRWNVFVVTFKCISWQQLIYKKRWRINTGLCIALWNSSDLPTILKCNQLFFYHAAIVPECNWIISFYSRLGAVVWRTFDSYSIIQRKIHVFMK